MDPGRVRGGVKTPRALCAGRSAQQQLATMGMHRVSPASEKADVHVMLLPVMAAFNHSRITHWTHAHWMDAESCLSTESAPHCSGCPQKSDALCPEERSACTDGRTRGRRASTEPARRPAAVSGTEASAGGHPRHGQVSRRHTRRGQVSRRHTRHGQVNWRRSAPPKRQPAAILVTVTTPMRYWSPVLDATTVLIPSSRDVGAKHFASTPSELA
jgi:hypothetical protein